MRADLDTLLIAVYCAACSLFPAPPRRGAAGVVPAGSATTSCICLMVAQMLLGVPSDRRFLPVAGWRLRHLFPLLPCQTDATTSAAAQLAPEAGHAVARDRLRAARLPRLAVLHRHHAAAVRAEPCTTVNRAELAPWCGFGYSRRPLPLLLGHAARALVRPRRLRARLRSRPRQRARARGGARTARAATARRPTRDRRQGLRRRRRSSTPSASSARCVLRPSSADEPAPAQPTDRAHPPADRVDRPDASKTNSGSSSHLGLIMRCRQRRVLFGGHSSRQ